jgi:hypothetical protein
MLTRRMKTYHTPQVLPGKEEGIRDNSETTDFSMHSHKISLYFQDLFLKTERIFTFRLMRETQSTSFSLNTTQ